MKVILQKDVPALGVKDDVKDVNDGYARNFLLPRGLARMATEESIRTLEAAKAHKKQKSGRDTKGQTALIRRLASLTLRFKMKARESGKTFGSVTVADIVRELAIQKVAIEQGWIKLANSIKETGEHTIEIKLPSGEEAALKVIVEAEV